MSNESLVPSTSIIFPAKWRPTGLVTFNVLGILLLLSWLWEPTRVLWDLFDDALFVDLNSRLNEADHWARFWAFMNIRPMDIASGLVMLLFVIRSGLVFSAQQVRAALLTFIALLLLVLSLRVAFNIGVVKPLMLTRDSPSLVIPEAVRLSELFPDWTIPVKDASSTSFPGDHASIALLWALLLSCFARGWQLMAIWGMTVVLLLPRLVAGAHWGSDDFVGGLFVAFLSIGWGCYTPYAAFMERSLEKLTTPVRLQMARWPLVRRLAVMR